MRDYIELTKATNAAGGFARDVSYMKLDVWGKDEESANTEIHRVFGHDVGTYPNIDNPQHYATVQFAGDPSTNNKNVVLKDHYTEARTEINRALRAVTDNAEGKFARDGVYDRESLWVTKVEPNGVQRTDRGKREDLDTIRSREDMTNTGIEFEHATGYMQTDIFGEKEVSVTAPVEVVEDEECTVDISADCEDGTLGRALAAGEAAASQVDKIVKPMQP